MYDVYQILSRFPSLVQYKHIADIDTSDRAMPLAFDRAPELRLPSLQDFSIFWDSTEGIWHVFDRLSMPSLQRFCFEDQICTDTRLHWPSLFSLFQRSRPPMIWLTICKMPVIPESQLIELLSWMPTLKGLKLDFSQNAPVAPEGSIMLTAEFWSALAGIHPFQIDPMLQEEGRAHFLTPVGRPICPQLEWLDLHLLQKTQLVEVAAVITMRFPSYDWYSNQLGADGKNLGSLALGACDFSEEEFLAYPGIEKYAEAGLSVSITQLSGVFEILCKLSLRRDYFLQPLFLTCMSSNRRRRSFWDRVTGAKT